MRMETRHVGKGRHVITFRADDGTAAFVDELRPSSSRERQRFLEQVRERLPAVDAERVLGDLLQLADRAEDADDNAPREGGEPADAPEDLEAARETLRSGDLMDQIGADLSAIGIASDRDLAKLVYLSFVSRLLDCPVCLFVQGPSSTGKTFIGKQVASLMPPEDVFDVQGMTAQVLNYMDDRLKHRVLQMGEWSREDDQSENGIRTAALRQLISDGKISRLFTNTESGRPEAEQATTEGPVCVYATSTLPISKIFEEDENRFQIVHTDEREEATRSVLARKAEQAAGMVQASDEILDGIRRRHHAMQREIRRQDLAVVVPFAPALERLFPSDQPRRRRDFDKLVGLIRSSALLHYCQRVRDESGRVVASVDDYRAVHDLLAPFAGDGEATPAALRKLAKLRERFDTYATFKRRDAEQIWRLKKARTAELIGELTEADLLRVVSEGLYQLTDATGERRTILPSPERVREAYGHAA